MPAPAAESAAADLSLAAISRRPALLIHRIDWVGWVSIGGLLAVLALHGFGFVQDIAAAIHYPFELDYGEGIVWQQAALIAGPRMYPSAPDLPFVVFHYPPLYHLLVRGMLRLEPDFLAAGRLASGLAGLLLAPMVAGLVAIAIGRPHQPLGAMEIAVALAAGLLVFCLHAVHVWSLLMRVDAVAIALSMLGLLSAAVAHGRFWGVAAALLLCTAAVFTKQTELPAGIAVFLMALSLNPRNAVAAAVVAGSAGLIVVGWLQAATGGGFMHNVIALNVNRWSPLQALQAGYMERGSLRFAVLMVAACVLVARSLPSRRRDASGARWPGLLAAVRQDRGAACRALLLVTFAMATLMLATVFKSGATFNYFMEWLTLGCALIGIAIVDLARAGPTARRRFLTAIWLLLLGAAALPARFLADLGSTADLARQSALVVRIAAAAKPVASEEMTLLMRAGKPVIFEPAIVTELAAVGSWDERPLVAMVRAGGFAFMITTGDDLGGSARRSPAVDAAMRAAYPREEHPTPELWLHLPPA